MIVHLNGWPGVGKKTIGQELSKLLEARFIHNHMLHDVGIICAGVDLPERWVVYEQVRAAAYQALRNCPQEEIFVMTNALCQNAPRELEAWNHVVDLAMARNAPLIPVVLETTAEENFRRIQSEDRIGKKMVDAKELESYFSIDKIQCPAVPELLVLDVTAMKPVEAANRIVDHVNSWRNKIKPASTSHRQFAQ